MFRHKAAAATATLIAGPALADVTPREVWQDWHGGAVALEAAEQREEGGALILDGVTARLPGGGTVMIDALRLEPEGADVRVSASDGWRLVDSDGAEGAITAPGASMRVSGEAGDLSYDMTAPALEAEWSGLLRDGRPVSLAVELDTIDAEIAPRPGGIALLLDAIRGRFDLATTDDRDGEVVAEQFWTEPALSYEGTLATLLGLAPPAPAGALTAFRLATSGAASRVSTGTARGPVTVETDSAETSLRAAIGGGRILLDQTARQTAVSLDGAGAPLPGLNIDVGRFAAGIDLPAAPADGAQALSLRIDAGDVTLADGLWARIDPEGSLPRDPASFTADLGGTARVAGDAATGGNLPLLFDQLDITRIALDALGARASATGRLSWPGGTRTGRERPVGRLALTFDGVEPLIKRLSDAGLVAEGPALVAQLALSQFSQAQGTDGSRTSQVVFGSDGAVTVEGVRVR